VLEQHQGQRNAIRSNELARYLKTEERRVRVAIQELIKDGVPICSSVSEPYGYFMVTNSDEALHYIKVLEEREKEIRARRESFERAAEKHFTIPRQTGLF
jgi:predicted DNA-binding transcriptional regulator